MAYWTQSQSPRPLLRAPRDLRGESDRAGAGAGKKIPEFGNEPKAAIIVTCSMTNSRKHLAYAGADHRRIRSGRRESVAASLARGDVTSGTSYAVEQEAWLTGPDGMRIRARGF
jgi:hypothetical protein